MSSKKRQGSSRHTNPQESIPEPRAPKQAVQREQATAATPDFFTTLGNKAVYLAFGLIALMAFLVYKDYLLGINYFFFKDIGSDSYNYSYPATLSVAEYIRQSGVPSWSFHIGMGQSLFPFFLRDPFDILLYLGGPDHIYYLTGVKEFIKVVLSGLIFFQYLKTLRLTAFTSIAGSLFFAFCAFMIMGGGWYFFSFEALNLALILLAFEKLLLQGKWYLFPIAIMLVCISQPFNLYVYGLFLAGYAVLRLFQEGTYDLKSGAIFFLKMAGLGVLGVVLSGTFLLENVVQLLESPRGSGNTSYAGILSGRPVFQPVDKFQLGTAITRFFSTDLMGSGTNFKGWTNTLEAPLFYCGIPCLLLMPQLFPFLKKRTRTFFLIFLGIWLMPLFFPWFRYAFWLFTGDYYRAYSVVVAVFLIYYSVQALDHIVRERKVNIPILAGSTAFYLLILNYPFFPEGEYISSPVFTFVCFILLVHAAVLFFLGKPNRPAYMLYIFLAAAALELTYFSHISVNDRDPVTAEEVTERKGYNDYTLDALKYANEHDKSFFRIDKNYASSPAIHYSLNDGQAQGYNGTCGYNPFNQLHYIRYLQLMGISDKNNEQESRWARGLVGRPILESADRVAYMMEKGAPVPLWRVMGDSVGRFGDVTLFRNKFLLPFGYTYDHYIRESVFSKLSITQRDFVTLRACVVNDEDIAKAAGLTEFNLSDTISPNGFNLDMYRQQVDQLAKESLSLTAFDNTHIIGKVGVAQKKLMYMSLPWDGGWSLTVDGKPRDKEVLFAGMTGVYLDPGQHTIELTYKLRYLGTGIMLSVLGLLLYAGLWFYLRRKTITDPLS